MRNLKRNLKQNILMKIGTKQRIKDKKLIFFVIFTSISIRHFSRAKTFHNPLFFDRKLRRNLRFASISKIHLNKKKLSKQGQCRGFHGNTFLLDHRFKQRYHSESRLFRAIFRQMYSKLFNFILLKKIFLRKQVDLFVRFPHFSFPAREKKTAYKEILQRPHEYT